MKNCFAPILASAFCFSAAFAQDGPPPNEADEIVEDAPAFNAGAAPNQDDVGRLILFARHKREKEGCAAAAPTFRVIAGMGEGQEAAQHELAECLLTMKGITDAETALFRREGEFWLTRAAYAGNARAQRKLAMEMAAPASALHDPKGALQWALIYGKNTTADLYGFGPLPPTLVPGLKSSLNATALAEAESFAKSFTPIALSKYEAPKRDEKRGAHGDRPRARPEGGRRRGPGVAE